MSRRTIQMHEYRQVLILMRNGKSNREIAKLKLLSRTKAKKVREVASVNNWLSKSELPTDAEIHDVLCDEVKTPQLILPFKDNLEKWHAQGVSAVVAFRVLQEQYSFTGSYNAVQRFMKTLKISPENDATIILKFEPGEHAQVDFGKGPNFYDKNLNKKVSSWFFVMTLCWSRHQYVEVVDNQRIETWLGCHKRAFEWFGGIVDTVIIDNASCAIAKASYTDPEATRAYADFAKESGFIISPCPPYDPEKKGIVESGVKYVKRNFLPLKNFDSLVDANKQAKTWLLNIAGKRKHGTTKEQPLLLFKTEKLLLKPLPRKFPEIYIWKKLLANRNCHVRYRQCQYSFPYKLIGKKLWIQITETNVKIYDNHKLVALHPRLTGAGEVSTIQEHYPPKAKTFLLHNKDWCLEKSKEVGPYCYELISSLLKSKPVDMLRSSQAIIYLKDKFGITLLNFACKRALEHGTLRYNVIKSILESNVLDDEHEQAKEISEIYKGNSEYQRDIKSIYH